MRLSVPPMTKLAGPKMVVSQYAIFLTFSFFMACLPVMAWTAPFTSTSRLPPSIPRRMTNAGIDSSDGRRPDWAG